MADSIAREVFGLLFDTRSDAGFVVDRATGRIVSACAPPSCCTPRSMR